MGPSPSKTARDVTHSIASHLVLIVTGFALTPLIARILGAEALGAWAIIGTLALFLRLSDLGLTTVVQRAAASSDRAAASEAIGLCLLSVAVLAPLLGAASFVGLEQLPGASEKLRRELPAAAAIALAGGLAGAWASPFRGFLLARGALQALARSRLASAVVQIAVSAAGLLLWPSLLWAALGLLLGQATELALILVSAFSIDGELPRGPRLPRHRARIKQALRDGAATLVINLAVVGSVRIDVLILSRVSTLEVVAAYSVASRVIDQLLTLAKQVSTAFLHRLGDPDARRRTQALVLGTSLLGVSVASGMVAVAWNGQPLLILWAGSVAAGSVTKLALIILGAAAIGVGLSEIPSAMLTMSATSVWVVAVPIAGTAALNVFISIAGASRFGVWAVAGGTVVGNFASCALAWRLVRRAAGWDWTRVLGLLAPPLAAVALAALLSALLANLATRGPLASALVVLCSTAAGCAAGGALAMLGPISRERLESTRAGAEIEPAA